jgi:hypothetical protein
MRGEKTIDFVGRPAERTASSGEQDVAAGRDREPPRDANAGASWE